MALSEQARLRFRPLQRPHRLRYECRTNDSPWISGRLKDKIRRRSYSCDGCLDRNKTPKDRSFVKSHGKWIHGAPMLRRDLWKRIAGDAGVWLCTDCVRKRLGRPHISYDFKWPWYCYEMLPSWFDSRHKYRNWWYERNKVAR